MLKTREKLYIYSGQIKSVSHKNLSLGGTSFTFGIHVLLDPSSQKSMLHTLKKKMAAISQDGYLIKSVKGFSVLKV